VFRSNFIGLWKNTPNFILIRSSTTKRTPRPKSRLSFAWRIRGFCTLWAGLSPSSSSCRRFTKSSSQCTFRSSISKIAIWRYHHYYDFTHTHAVVSQILEL
jgi:hypothetical protein